VADGVYPAPAAVQQALGADSGLSLGYNPGPWPAS
jgi:hypothetical protein